MTSQKPLHIAYMAGDGFFGPSPASRRAFEIGLDALRARGHTVTELLDENLWSWASLYYSCVDLHR
jgi:hypothetical protein